MGSGMQYVLAGKERCWSKSGERYAMMCRIVLDVLLPQSFQRLCNQKMTDVHGRTFGVWTLLTCTLCFLCAFNLDNKPLYLVTFLSFIYAFGHFLTEFLIYKTMAITNMTTVGIFAGTSIIWMLLQWNSHQKNHQKHN
ncbi:ergosterol biosynthetic protein 28 isoform X1 [Punica granatum]|uniref:Ergosterol biosynthetic protein 28 isoform X1 n=1 Tax=Punica granatum TaxID=22663 RepID=A0A6P8BW21_PUNGR|nr:ergosterol biosynthetic protein 28 isoform X1 [Punica granatum]